jgi:glycosyl transferase family 87
VRAHSVAHTRSVLPLLQRSRIRLNRVLWLLVAFLAVYHVILVAQFTTANRFYDFAHYYLYARNLLEGRDLFDLEAPRLLAEQLGIRFADSPPNYPPTFYLVMVILAALPYHYAAVVWVVLNEVFLLMALIWRGAWRFHRNLPRIATLALVVLAFQPLYETLALGQANLLLLAGITLVVQLWSRASIWTGVALGMVVLVKPQFALLALLWLRPSEWRHLGTAAATVSIAVLMSFPLVDPDAWTTYLQYLGNFPCAVSLWALNVSLRGLLFRLKGGCEADGFGDPLAVGTTVLGLVIVCLLALYVWRNQPTGPTGRFRIAGLTLCVILLTSPYTQEHHLTVLLLVFAGLALDPHRPMGIVQQGGWILAYVLLATAYSLVRFPGLHLGPFSVLLFGKGLGVVLLVVLLLWTPRRRYDVPRSLLPLMLVAVGGVRAAHAVVKGVVLGEIDVVVLSEIALAAGLLLSWAMMFRARLVQVME